MRKAAHRVLGSRRPLQAWASRHPSRRPETGLASGVVSAIVPLLKSRMKPQTFYQPLHLDLATIPPGPWGFRERGRSPKKHFPTWKTDSRGGPWRSEHAAGEKFRAANTGTSAKRRRLSAPSTLRARRHYVPSCAHVRSANVGEEDDESLSFREFKRFL